MRNNEKEGIPNINEYFVGLFKVLVTFPPSQEKLKKVISAPVCELIYRRAGLFIPL